MMSITTEKPHDVLSMIVQCNWFVKISVFNIKQKGNQNYKGINQDKRDSIHAIYFFIH